MTSTPHQAIRAMAPAAPELTAVDNRAADVRWRPYLNVANFVTTVGFVCGIAACYEAVAKDLPAAAALILVAAVTDVADGIIARRTGTAGPFGDGLDSLSDLVCFGAAPAAMIFYTQLGTVPVAGAIIAIAWCVTTKWRLALYMVRGHQPDYVGCPAPVAASIITVVALARPGVPVISAFAIALAIVMVCKLRFPGWHTIWKASA